MRAYCDHCGEMFGDINTPEQFKETFRKCDNCGSNNCKRCRHLECDREFPKRKIIPKMETYSHKRP